VNARLTQARSAEIRARRRLAAFVGSRIGLVVVVALLVAGVGIGGHIYGRQLARGDTQERDATIIQLRADVQKLDAQLDDGNAKLAALQRAVAGETFEYEGRPVHVTPSPVTPGGPLLMYGGHSVAAARRAGRLGLGFFAEADVDGLVEAYEAGAAETGATPGMCSIPKAGNPTTVFVAEDVDDGWARIGPYMLHDAQMYASWFGGAHPAASRSEATSVEQLRAEEGPYRVVTPDEAVAMIRGGQPLGMQPLCGGLPPDIAWESLRLVERRVLPALG